MQSKYKRLQEEMKDAYFLIQDAKIQVLGSSELARLGYDEDELVGMPFTHIFPSEVHKEILEIYEGLLVGHTTSDRLRTDLVTADGTRIPIEVSAWPTWHQGKPAVAGIVLDMSGRQKTEQALRESEEKLRVMLESIAEGIAVIDLESRITDMNTVMLGLYGYESKEEVIGRSAFEFIPPKSQPKAMENMSRALSMGYSENLEITLQDKDGNEYEAEISGAPLRDKSGEPVGFIAVTKDITERKRAQEEIQYRLLFEELIANISTKFINYTPEEIDDGITNALQAIAEFSGVDRSHVCLLSDGGKMIEKVYEWCAEGIDSQIVDLQGVTEESCPWWVERLKRFENIQISNATELPASAILEREKLGLQSVKSSLTVPMHHGGILLGFLGFHSIKNEKLWSDEDIGLLKIVGETFVNALARKQAEEALREAEELNRTLVETASKAGEGLAVFQDTDEEKGICLFVNEEFARIVGYSREELQGQPVPETIPPQMRKVQGSDDENQQSEEEIPSRFELELSRIDGETIPVDIGVVSTTYQGRPATVIYVTDITERKKQEEVNLELQETLKFYSNQVAKASKELVHAIRGVEMTKSNVPSVKGQGFAHRTSGVDEVELLTPREIQVLQLAARGMSNKDIGSELGITVRTVKGHLMNIYAKMNVKSRTEAVSCALKEGWITLEDMGQGIG